MRVGTGILLMILLTSTLADPILAANYTPLSLIATSYPDGVVGIEYVIDLDPLAVRVSIPLFGSDVPDLLVVNQDGLPLVATQAGSTITIDALGATSLTITYSTQELTSKLGNLWTLNVTSPTNLEAWLPAGATIVSFNQMPLSVTTIGGRIQVILPPGSDSISYVISQSVTSETAQAAIDKATAAIRDARDEGRTSNIAAAEALLGQAKTGYTSGDYASAKSAADQAYSQATTSKAAFNYTLLGGVVILLAAAGAIVYLRRRRASPLSTPELKADDGAVSLELVFQRNPDMRVDDKEVIRFLSERDGEAFANEIRDRFDIPRTSAWRMIRRLISAGVVEERKIGGQSLIYVAKKYRKAKEE